MKKMIVLVAVVLISLPVMAQEETLFDGYMESGGFGGPVVKFTRIKSEFGLLVGGRGGWIINHMIVLGGGGYGLVNNIKAPVEEDDLYINMGYGGGEIGFVSNSDNLMHFDLFLLIGGGGVNYSDRNSSNGFDLSEDVDVFFVMEPSADFILNVTSFFRFALGGSYRYVSGVEIDGLSDTDLSGFSLNVTLKFGSF